LLIQFSSKCSPDQARTYRYYTDRGPSTTFSLRIIGSITPSKTVTS